jgi:hypothetical protein
MPKGDEITICGYWVLTSAECTTVMIAVLIVASGPGSSLDLWELVWFGYGRE